MLVDLVTQRPIVPMELWLIQGWPHPGLPGIDKKLAKFFPFKDLVHASDGKPMLSASDQRILTGNGMHWVQMGAWNLRCLFGLSKAVLRAAMADLS